jgi:hypothetical protein
LLPGAVIVYEYVFNDETVTCAERLPVFFAGKGLSDLAGIFAGWDVAEFNPSRVTLRRGIDKTARDYIIGIYGGHVAVFHDCGSGEYALLKYATDKPVAALSAGERERLASGIRVSGDDALFVIMQDYES